MLISDRTRIGSIAVELTTLAEDKDLPPKVKEALHHISQRFNQFAQDVILQLNSRPMIFTVDPRKYPEKVRGARPGDVSIFTNDSGDVEIVQFQ